MRRPEESEKHGNRHPGRRSIPRGVGCKGRRTRARGRRPRSRRGRGSARGRSGEPASTPGTTREECEELHVRRRVLGPAAAFEKRALRRERPLRHVADKRHERRRVRGHAQRVVHRTCPHREAEQGHEERTDTGSEDPAGMGNRVEDGAAAGKLGSDSLESEADVGEPVRDRLGAFLRGLQRSEELGPRLYSLGSVGHGQAGARRPRIGDGAQKRRRRLAAVRSSRRAVRHRQPLRLSARTHGR